MECRKHLSEEPETVEAEIGSRYKEQDFQKCYQRPKKGAKVTFQLANDETIVNYRGTILGPAEKCTDKFKDPINVSHDFPQNESGKIGAYDWRNDINYWQYYNTDESAAETVLSVAPDHFPDAKMQEIENWHANDVFEEVTDKGQDYVTVRWVLTEKEPGKKRLDLWLEVSKKTLRRYH